MWISDSVLKYCAEECERQGSGEISVFDMANAWDFARGFARINDSFDAGPYQKFFPTEEDLADYIEYSNSGTSPRLTVDFIGHLGKLVEPLENDTADGFRQRAVGISDGWTWTEKMNWDRVRLALSLLLASYYEGKLTPTHAKAETSEDQFYYDYEGIHPFMDGNGRTGKILYNYLKGTLDDPVMPPNFWNIANP